MFWVKKHELNLVVSVIVRIFAFVLKIFRIEESNFVNDLIIAIAYL